MDHRSIIAVKANKTSGSQDFKEVHEAAASLQGQAATLAARLIRDGTLRLQFNREIACFAQGIVSELEEGLVSLEDALHSIKQEARNLLKQAHKIAPKVIGLAAGAAQIKSGLAVCYGSLGTACAPFGAPLLAHGSNNVYENFINLVEDRSDTEGPLRKLYRDASKRAGGTDYHGDMAYGLVDLGLSVYGLARLTVKEDAWRLWKYTRADKVRGYQTASGAALTLEAAGDAVTLKGMFEQWRSQSE